MKTLHDGSKIPMLGLGTYLGDATAVSYALETGYRLLDTAALYKCATTHHSLATMQYWYYAGSCVTFFYSNEDDVGKAIRESGIPREHIYVVTKVFIWDV